MQNEFSPPKTVSEVINVYLHLASGRDGTLKGRLSFWAVRFGDKPLSELSADDVDDGLAVLETTPARFGKMRTGPTINRYRAAMQGVIKFARQKRLLPRGWVSPFADVPQHRENPGKMRFLTLAEEKKLISAARVQQWVLLPLLIRLAIVTGLRRGALLGLTWGDVHLDDKIPHVSVQRTKNGDPHVSPITPDLVKEFRRMKRAKAENADLIFIGKHDDRPHDFRHCFKEACKTAGIEGATFHTLRHTSCSRLAQAGVGILDIAEHAGHRSLTMTRRYSHLCIKNRASTVCDVFTREEA